MKRSLIYLCLSIFFLAGCIHNDLPYPIVVPHITSMEVQDAVDIDIDYDNQTVTVYVSETTDLRTVVVQSVEFDMELAKPSVELTGVHDLTSPLKFTISTYQEYKWTLKAERPVERYLTIEGQIGSAHIDEYNHRVLVMMPEGSFLENLTVTSMKLGPRDVSQYSLELSEMKDFTYGLDVDVTAFGETQTWTIFVEYTDIKVQISKLNPWTRNAYVTAMGIAGNDVRFQYRQSGTEDWSEVKADCVSVDGGTFVAEIKDLTPSTAYEVIVWCGEDRSLVGEFTTAPDTKIPNGSFENVSLVSGSGYYKFYDPACSDPDGQYMFWGSGNGEGSEGVQGSASMGIVITDIDKDQKVDGKQSVRAQTSQLAGILAAGNLFTGQFAGLVGTSGGMVNFGRPWTTRPLAVKLHCKYVTSKIDIITSMPPAVNLTKDDYDRAQVKVALGSWDYKKYKGTPASPVHINTTDASTFVDFRKDESTIAYGELIIHKDGYSLNGSDTVSALSHEWAEYTIPLNYKSIEEIPTHIIISCASSQYGDYFTGCSTSKLWIDKVELVY